MRLTVRHILLSGRIRIDIANILSYNTFDAGDAVRRFDESAAGTSAAGTIREVRICAFAPVTAAGIGSSGGCIASRPSVSVWSSRP